MTSTRLRAALTAATIGMFVGLTLSGCIPVPMSPGANDDGTAAIPETDAASELDTDADGIDASGGAELIASKSGRVNCDPADVVRASGEGITVEVFGQCGTVEVRGNGVDVSIESAERVLIEGQGADVEVESDLESAVIRGNGNDLSGRDAGSIEVSGGGNDLEFRQIGALALHGNDNTVETALEPGAFEDDGQRNFVGRR